MTKKHDSRFGETQSGHDELNKTVFKVIVNDDGQYAICPAEGQTPWDWRDAGKTGLRSECLAYIEAVSPDMRPPDMRRAMEEIERQRRHED